MAEPSDPSRGERALELLGAMCAELDELERSCAATEGHLEQLRRGLHAVANAVQPLAPTLARIEQRLDALAAGQHYLDAKLELVQNQVIDGFRAQGARVERLELRDHGKRLDETR